MSESITPTEFHRSPGVGDWRVVGDGACAFYRTESFAAGAELVRAIGALDSVEDHPPDVDLRPGGITIRLVTATEELFGLTRTDLELARAIAGVARELGLEADPSQVQSVLIVVESLVPAEVMPFWRAVLGYQPRLDTPDEDLVDTHGRGPAFWFEPIGEARPRPGGVHVAVWVPVEQAEARVAAALAAGGRLVRDAHAPSWWTLADAMGNEADIATTQGRD
jgi:4a-hydroxytetrahydrobiopterin dehydratase